ncbi:cytochrome P450 [Mycobacterium sp. Y57]|uniref:cytochrome P450 n=1 Tax=Mycolicibacterium xanthum TaxID=2796469 RepID=UPI001C847329|nr:cytochrome P450 [Mycolicibacterium xanthum]MBX7430517.1 cytochrome P450 [Mycolicibacterium xanthum]
MTVESATSGVDMIDLTKEDFRHGFPHEVFTVLREQAPVWRHPDTPGTDELGGSFWVVSSNDAVKEVSANHATFRSFEGPSIPDWPEQARGMMVITMDPPEHTRLRRLVTSGFTARMTAMLEDQARAWAIKIIDRALDKGECNFVEDVAYQLPMHMIADMMGIPEPDRAPLFGATLAAIEAQAAKLPKEEQLAAMGKLFAYSHELADRKRRSPGDDVWTKLVNAVVELPDGTSTQLTELELELFFQTLVIAGSETTRDATVSGLLALLENPQQMELLRSDPSVIGTAVEEIARWASPVAYFRRTAATDTVLQGAHIAAGDRVTLWYPSANRDARVFKDPFRFDITRNPNPHVAFGGHGAHHCLGANLARREMRVMFQELIARTSAIELLGEPVYRPGGIHIMTSYGIKDLPVRLIPR